MTAQKLIPYRLKPRDADAPEKAFWDARRSRYVSPGDIVEFPATVKAAGGKEVPVVPNPEDYEMVKPEAKGKAPEGGQT